MWHRTYIILAKDTQHVCMIKTKSIPYSGKLWRALNLVNQSSKCIGEFLFWRSWALLHRAIVYEIILVGFKFGDCPQNHQFAKLKILPKFPTIWYLRCSYTYTRTHLPTQHHEVRLCFHKSLHRFLFHTMTFHPWKSHCRHWSLLLSKMTAAWMLSKPTQSSKINA